MTALPSPQGVSRPGQWPISTWLRDRTLKEKVTEESPELDSDKKNKQGVLKRKKPSFCVRQLSGKTQTHTDSHTSSLKGSQTTQPLKSFQTPLGSHPQQGLQSVQIEMTIKTLIFLKPMNGTLSLYGKLSGATKSLSFLSLP